MQEAFGPHTDTRITEETDRLLDWQDCVVAVVYVFALIVVVVTL